MASFFFGLLGSLAAVMAGASAYEPTWESLDKRPAPSWFFEEKFFVFIHWGLFSVPAWSPVGTLSEWYKEYLMDPKGKVAEFHRKNYGNASCTATDCTAYSDFKHSFHAELWNPDQWMSLFKRAGARGIMFTTKHCDGYTHWKSPSKPGYNSVEAGPKRDIVADLTTAVRKTDLRLGFYYCDCEWGQNSAAEWPWPGSTLTREQLMNYSATVWYPDMVHLASTYEPDMFFPDYGGSCGFDSETLRARKFLAWLYTNSTIKDKVIVGDRLGKDANCKHGDYYTCRDRYQPQSLQNHLWMDAMTVARSWGLNRQEGPDDYQSAEKLIHILIDNVAYGGVLTLNVGPAADGSIIPLQAERLLDMGKWLQVNGDAIYKTIPWHVQHERDNATGTEVYYTSSQGNVYAIMTSWPKVQIVDGKPVTSIKLAAPTMNPGATASLLGYTTAPLKLQSASSGGVEITFPTSLGPAELPCEHAWTIKLTGVRSTTSSSGHTGFV